VAYCQWLKKRLKNAGDKKLIVIELYINIFAHESKESNTSVYIFSYKNIN